MKRFTVVCGILLTLGTAASSVEAQKPKGAGGSTGGTTGGSKVASVTVTPSTTTIDAGQCAQFTAVALDNRGKAIPGTQIAWTMGSATGFRAGQTDGQFCALTPLAGAVNTSIMATATGTAFSGSASLAARPSSGGTTTPPPPTGPTVATVTLTPGFLTLDPGQCQRFTATARDAQGTAIPNVAFTWAVSDQQNFRTGQVPGEFCAPNPSGGANTSMSVTATPSGVSAYGSMIANPSPPVVASVTLTPSFLILDPGQCKRFTATALDASGRAIPNVAFTWAPLSPGTVFRTGQLPGEYCAPNPSTAANHPVSATATPSGISAHGAMMVNPSPPAVARVTLTPTMGTVTVGQCTRFTATALDAADNVIPNVAFTWSAPQLAAFRVGQVPGEYCSVAGTGAANMGVSATATPSGVSGHAAMMATP